MEFPRGDSGYPIGAEWDRLPVSSVASAELEAFSCRSAVQRGGPQPLRDAAHSGASGACRVSRGARHVDSGGGSAILNDLAGGDSELAARIVTTLARRHRLDQSRRLVNRRGLFDRTARPDVFRDERWSRRCALAPAAGPAYRAPASPAQPLPAVAALGLSLRCSAQGCCRRYALRSLHRKRGLTRSP
jgi:hypothetical protein